MVERLVRHFFCIILCFLILPGLYAYQEVAGKKQSSLIGLDESSFTFENSRISDSCVTLKERSNPLHFPLSSPMEENDENNKKNERDEVENDNDNEASDGHCQQKKLAEIIIAITFANDFLNHVKPLAAPLYITQHSWRHFLS